MGCRPFAACTVDGAPARLWSCDTPWDWAGLLVHLSRNDHRELSVRMLANAFVDIPRHEQPRVVLEWVQENVRYEPDDPPARLRAWLAAMQAGKPGDPFERFSGPGRTIGRGAGDCDDSSRVVRAVLRCLGHNARLVFIGDRNGPHHVTAAIPTPSGQWFWLDASLPARAGEHPNRAKERLDGLH